VWTNTPGASDLRQAADQLAARLPTLLAPLARLAFNYAWSWMQDGNEVFEAIDPHRWRLCQHNPVRLLQETPTASLDRAAADPELRRRARNLEERLLSAPPLSTFGSITPERPVAFLCAEYGIHPSLPVYSGGLGVLAGDMLKAASSSGFPMVGVGLMYRYGYFRQRIDVSGWQHEYWVETDPERLPAALVTANGVDPLTVSVPIRGRDVVAQIWRVDVGRVPLYLLDTDRAENPLIDRWITGRLYVGDRETRLAQYTLLGLGGIRALRALRIEPSVVHLNEGHAVMAPYELVAEAVQAGRSLAEALEVARRRTVFTTHTPVPAGNESYPAEDIRRVMTGLPERLGSDWETLHRLGRMNPDDTGEPIGMTQAGLRISRSANGVSRRHGATAREMWRAMYPGRAVDAVPIGHVTNGVHVQTWMAAPMRALLDRHLGDGWVKRVTDPGTWAKLDAVPDAELWAVRRELRARLVTYARERATADRLARGEDPDYVQMASRAFDPDILTVGFARRLATYKRLHIVTFDLQRTLRLLGTERPLQLLLAGKAHPMDDSAKRIVQLLFEARRQPNVGQRVAYLHDYDMELASYLVAGCDVWVNLPRPPFEASGTSGMKAALNGGLNLSVLDGWWAEGYDGTNGWAIDGDVDADEEAQDRRHAATMLRLLEEEIVPRFYDRDAAGVPRAWLAMVRASIRTGGLQFSAQRMLADYVSAVYLADDRTGVTP
jgi:starch phosphorylase